MGGRVAGSSCVSSPTVAPCNYSHLSGVPSPILPPPWLPTGGAQELHHPRPRMVLTGAIAHGYCTSFFLASERVTHGADCFLEVLFRTIQQVADVCTARGDSVPEHLVVQSDNTVSQTKNTYVHVAVAYLVATKQFKTVSLNYLMVGHTHEDIGTRTVVGGE